MEYKVEESRREDLFTIYISSTFPETQSTGDL